MDFRGPCNLHWVLKKYARFTEPNATEQSCDQGSSHGEWQTYDSTTVPARLVLTEAPNLLVLQGDRIQENYSLAGVGESIRGISRGDTLLLLMKMKDSTRRFRVQFAELVDTTGVDQCENCVQHLSTHVHIKNVQIQGAENTDTSVTNDLPLPTMAKILTGDVTTSLPQAYQQADIEPENLDMLVRLCLTDPTFPSLVAGVQEKLNDIIGEMT